MLVPAVIEGTKKLLRDHMVVVGKDAVADAPVPAADRNTIVETVDQGTEEQGHYHEDGDSLDRQVVSEHLEGLMSTACHAASEEEAWVAHAALGADGDSSCPKHDIAPACLSSSEVKCCSESSHMTRQ